MKKIFAMALFVFIANSLLAQKQQHPELYNSIRQMDSLIFDEGFNKCNISQYPTVASDDIEFYHDKGGILSGKEAFISSVKNNICGSSTKMKRGLDSMNVFPLFNNNQLYGAVQDGKHSFYAFSNGKWDKTGDARFVHLWLLDNGQWKLKRVLSFDH